MLQLDNINDFEWRRLVERLDKGVAEAARSYLSQLLFPLAIIIPAVTIAYLIL